MAKGDRPIDTSLELYNELMAMAESEEDGNILGNNGLIAWDNDDDTEDVLTSKEIVQQKKQLEKVTGTSSIDDGIIEEEVYFKRYRTQKKKNYTETEMKKIREECETTVVHDYGDHDWYHVSDEKRADADQLREISDRLARLRRTYSRVDQYIAAMRVVFEAWQILARMNFIHSEEEFFEMIAEGRIVSSRIVMPKLKKMDQYNLDMIIQFISNPDLDIAHLGPIKKDEDRWFEDDGEEYETEEERMMRLLSKDEAAMILTSTDDPDSVESMKIADIEKKFIKGYDRRRNSFSRKKKKKKGNKTQRYITDELHALLNKIQNGAHYKDHGNSYMVTHSLFEQDKPVKSFWDEVHFDGSWADDDAVAILDLVLMEELMKQRPLKQRHLTYGDLQQSRFFEILEENGVNTVHLRQQMGVSTDETDRRIQSATKKENKEKERALLNRVIKLHNDKKFKKTAEKAEKELSDQRKGDIPGL